MSAFLWSELLHAGTCGLGLRPSEFWALTPAELALLLGRDAGDGPLNRDRLQALSRAFPDHKEAME